MSLVRCIASRGFGSPPASGSAITTPAITVTNNDDGTATVAISGATAGTTNEVWYVPIDNQWNDPMAWTSGGSRTGNGNVTVTTGVGVFWFYVISTDGSNYAASNIENEWISNGADSVWDQVLDAVQSTVRSLNLSGITSDRVLLLTQLDADEIRAVADSTGGVVIGPGGGELYPDGGPTTLDRVLYPVVVAGVIAANQDQTRAFRETWLLHRERIRKAFINQGLVTPTQTIITCKARQLSVIDQRAWLAMYLLSPLMLEFESRELRGIT